MNETFYNLWMYVNASNYMSPMKMTPDLIIDVNKLN